jgi:predicted ABC-type ATPase
MGNWDESSHPRDDKGRFGGGGGEAKKGLQAFANKVAGIAKADSHPTNRVWSDKLPEGMRTESWMGHYDASPEDGGKPLASRVASVHQRILKEALNVAPAEPGEQKRAIMTMGGPASGKSSMLKDIDTSRFVKVDPDSIKEQLPEYQKNVADRNNTFRGAAWHAHAESSDVAKTIMREAIKNGNHLIVDGTGRDTKSFLAKMDMLKAAGYTVHVAMPHLPVEQGMKRMSDRAQVNGRYVPDHIVKEAYQTIPKNFSTIAARADSAKLYDASPSKEQGGTRLVYEKKGDGREVHHDPEFMKAFKKEHG